MSAYTGRGVGSDILGGVIDLHGCDVDISGGAEGRIGGGHLPLSIGRFQGEGAPALRSILGAGKGGQELPLPFDGSSARGGSRGGPIRAWPPPKALEGGAKLSFGPPPKAGNSFEKKGFILGLSSNEIFAPPPPPPPRM